MEIDIELRNTSSILGLYSRSRSRSRSRSHQSTDEAHSAPVRPRKKTSEKQTDKQKNKQTNRKKKPTSRLLDQLGPEGRVGENILRVIHSLEKPRAPRVFGPEGFWPWNLPRDNIHHATLKAFSKEYHSL